MDIYLINWLIAFQVIFKSIHFHFKDKGTPQFSSETRVIVDIQDVGDTAPKFTPSSSYEARVDENLPIVSITPFLFGWLTGYARTVWLITMLTKVLIFCFVYLFIFFTKLF